ncbi:aspartyl-phosphate phosphatase Spo0E family protein [Metabacillus fastidiosus]|uniref:Aspartyl-phosphate phosphatase Spo0E family protein n=1 Tax=Metabacillus fastidiosus TaxID=1458 RepID=A0ABU6P4T2_9BACI|nr:aspartyl-phosphate phosphatase Spo0E family protein [Metabacillus fastidiosus]
MATDTLIDLREEIELKRREMYKAGEKSLCSPEVLKISQELDSLLNRLNKQI